MCQKYITLDDLLKIKKESGNNNPGIFLLPKSKKNKINEAFGPSKIFIDNIGDIIIEFKDEMIIN